MSSESVGRPEAAPKMHADELDAGASLVRRLVAAQLPARVDLAIEPVFPRSADNTMFRLGNNMAVRLPRRQRTVLPLEREIRWLPRGERRLEARIVDWL